MKSFKFDFSILDLNYMAILVAFIMLSITIFIIRKSHSETNENPNRHGFLSLVSYLFFYFLVIGFIWIGIIFDLAFGKKQKW